MPALYIYSQQQQALGRPMTVTSCHWTRRRRNKHYVNLAIFIFHLFQSNREKVIRSNQLPVVLYIYTHIPSWPTTLQHSPHAHRHIRLFLSCSLAARKEPRLSRRDSRGDSVSEPKAVPTNLRWHLENQENVGSVLVGQTIEIYTCRWRAKWEMWSIFWWMWSTGQPLKEHHGHEFDITNISKFLINPNFSLPLNVCLGNISTIFSKNSLNHKAKWKINRLRSHKID